MSVPQRFWPPEIFSFSEALRVLFFAVLFSVVVVGLALFGQVSPFPDDDDL